MISSVAILATLAACGGGESGDGFAAEADAICVESTREQAEIGLAAGRSEDLGDTAERMSKLAESSAGSVEQFEELTPPDESADTWSDYLGNRRQAVDLVEQRAAAAEQGDTQAVDGAALELQRLLVDRDALAEELGLESCARILPADDEERVREAVELASISGDGRRVCEEVVANVYLEAEFAGNVERCVRAQSRAQRSKSVEFRDVYGVAEVLATAEVELVGGALDGQSATVQLTYEEGSYRIFEVSTGSASADG